MRKQKNKMQTQVWEDSDVQHYLSLILENPVEYTKELSKMTYTILQFMDEEEVANIDWSRIYVIFSLLSSVHQEHIGFYPEIQS